MSIRVAAVGELPVLQDIERAAGRLFREIGMPSVAEDEPLSLEVLAGYQGAGRAWVRPDAEDRPLAYLIAEVVDGNLHLAQVSVHPDAARRGLGRALIDHAAAYARAERFPALTLITFARVPWNAPYYERCGFWSLDEGELTPGLRALRRQEAAQGLDRWPRVCMRRDL
ncbi:GNAT family N-acetyltransferase [Sphaerisporangium krabiense]|uniref:GNAT superfamily N-acetyltransferase n=1 Tax=Sphaerisporangium krabiense TaxID=763782 RepID=A0A7W8Z7Q3_9ACTN|nr:GNAT family N-acetyltransferase [Sphaerisporangium krabiense]MBB5629052.1 GNAT superfamily N-acetyltransferase [Sphaerisporangium krabiense]